MPKNKREVNSDHKTGSSGYEHNEAFYIVNQLFFKDCKPPFRIVGFSEFDNDQMENIAPEMGLIPDDFKIWDHPYPLWAEFRTKVKNGRYSLWILPQYDGSMIMLDTQLADKAFSNMNS